MDALALLGTPERYPVPTLPAVWQEHVLALSRCAAGTYKIPRGGIAYRCEACEQSDRIRPGTRVWVIAVPWAWTTYPGSIDALDLGERASVRVGAPGDPGRLLTHREVVVCQDCARSARERRAALSRCAHERADTSDRWERCGELVRGTHPRYCAEHRTPEAQHERERYRRRAKRASHEPTVGARGAQHPASAVLLPTEDELLAPSIPLGEEDYKVTLAPWVRLVREYKVGVPDAQEKVQSLGSPEEKRQLRTAWAVEEHLPDHVPGLGWRRGDKYDARGAAREEEVRACIDQLCEAKGRNVAQRFANRATAAKSLEELRRVLAAVRSELSA